MRIVLAVACLMLGSCAQLIGYSDDLTDPGKGRTLFVRAPAAFGGIVGFVAGLPVDLVALPVTWVIYRTQPKETRDPQSTLLFPSFVMWRAGVLVAVPLDLAEFAIWRWWQPRQAIPPEELERRERELDQQELKGMPVEWIYPRRVSAEAAFRHGGDLLAG